MLRLGLGQLLIEGGEAKRNFERAKKFIEEAAQENCDLILLPETLDFGWTHPSGQNEACSIPGEHSAYFCELAKSNNIWICLGLTEKENEDVYNSAILINASGDVVYKYRKINLIEVEKPYYRKGQNLGVVETPWGKIGVNICADNYLDSTHIGKSLVSMGADLIISPSSWTVDYNITEEDDPYKNKWLKPLHIIASYGDITIVNCTSVGYIVGGPYEGKKMVGCSLVVNQNGVEYQGPFCEFTGNLSVIDVI